MPHPPTKKKNILAKMFTLNHNDVAEGAVSIAVEVVLIPPILYLFGCCWMLLEILSFSISY